MTYVSPKKHLGQHFLRDENIAKKIVGSLSAKEKYKTVIEVGAGTGALTKYLLPDKSFKTYIVEIDRESIAFLKNIFLAPKLEHALFQFRQLKFVVKKRFRSHYLIK